MAVTDYYLLDYIESSGTQYIRTGVGSAKNINFDTKINIRQWYNDYCCVLGQISTNRYYRILPNKSGSICTDFNNTEIAYDNCGMTTNTDIVLSMTNLKIYVNNILKIDRSSESNWSSSAQIRIFADTNGQADGSPYYYSYMRMYYLNMYRDNSIIRKYVPVKRKSDDILGMYDLVENKFYTNVGSGSFIGGSILTGSISVSKNINEAGNISGGTGNKFPDGSIGTTLNATINNGYRFLGWYNSSGQLISTNTSYTYIGPEGASLVAKYTYLDNIIKPNKSLSPINFDFNNTMNGLQFRKWDSPRSPLILDMGANNASGSYRQVFIIGGDSINIYSCCIFTQGDDAYAKKTSLDTTNTTYSATKVGNLLTINFSSTIWGPTWVLWN